MFPILDHMGCPFLGGNSPESVRRLGCVVGVSDSWAPDGASKYLEFYTISPKKAVEEVDRHNRFDYILDEIDWYPIKESSERRIW